MFKKWNFFKKWKEFLKRKKISKTKGIVLKMSNFLMFSRFFVMFCFTYASIPKSKFGLVFFVKECFFCQIYNLGTGRGYSVLEMVTAFEKASGKKVAYEVVPRRGGDVASCYCDPTFVEKELGWKCQKNLEDMCKRWNIFKIFFENLKFL